MTVMNLWTQGLIDSRIQGLMSADVRFRRCGKPSACTHKALMCILIVCNLRTS
jgi:hypothetical protein